MLNFIKIDIGQKYFLIPTESVFIFEMDKIEIIYFGNHVTIKKDDIQTIGLLINAPENSIEKELEHQLRNWFKNRHIELVSGQI